MISSPKRFQNLQRVLVMSNPSPIALLVLCFVAAVLCGTCPGICQPDTYSCAGSYASGLCPGASNIKCCEGERSRRLEYFMLIGF